MGGVADSDVFHLNTLGVGYLGLLFHSVSLFFDQQLPVVLVSLVGSQCTFNTPHKLTIDILTTDWFLFLL